MEIDKTQGLTHLSISFSILFVGWLEIPLSLGSAGRTGSLIGVDGAGMLGCALLGKSNLALDCLLASIGSADTARI
ncbi:MAG: hypothetical protein MSA54_04750 [Campylobacter sp.]|uniref:hypothetical protein n=1 Tax=Campylobacter sp. TaxID=205 RepID=UPI002AA7EAE5|nr:hypothetical protein [Campylobacter sp.]MCI7501235.1 hypothetical protein [Campylobacter sp.]